MSLRIAFFGQAAFGKDVYERLLAQGHEIVGVDLLLPSDVPESVFRRDRILFLEMDAEELSFDDESRDAVAVSSALHHLPDPPKILGELWRVLRPGGHFIVRETHRNAESEPERSDMLLHHWVAKIDRLLDSYHATTYTRNEVLDLAGRLRLSDVRTYDVRNDDSDPFDAEAVQSTERTIVRYLQAAASLPNFSALQEGARELRHRLRDIGIQWEPEVFIIGCKP